MNYNEFIDRLFARLKEDEIAEAVYTAGSSFEVEVKNGELHQYSVSDSLSLKFRLIVNGRMGSASTQILDDEAVDLLIDGARENASLIESADEQFFYPGDSEYPEIPLYSQKLAQLSAAEKIELAKELEKRTLAQDSRIQQIEDCGLFYAEGEFAMRNTLGLNVYQQNNLLGGYTVAIAREGERVNTGSETFFVHDPEEIDLEAVARAAASDAVSGLNATPVTSGSYRILLRRDMAATMLSTFSGIFSAESAQRGLSLLKGMEGETIAAECVTLMDDPHRKNGGASCPFDGEGVATKVKPVIENGRLTTLLHNLKTANKQGVATTANASSGKDIAPSNFFFVPSERSEDEMLQLTGDGLFITDLMGMHAGANPVSGDFSLAAKGFLIKEGKLSRPVDQVTIAGNFYSLLKDIEAVGGDLHFKFPSGSCFGSPSLLIKKLSVAGI